MSPEYAMNGVYSTKSDVFSFGVLLLEIISGKKNTDSIDGTLMLNLIGHVSSQFFQIQLASYDSQTKRKCHLLLSDLGMGVMERRKNVGRS